MARRAPLEFNRPRLFSPATSRRLFEGTGAVYNKTGQDLADTSIESTSSFRYDPLGVGIKSTQQIPVDFSKFENHTFFNSAEVNVNVAFDRIINEFPFDGTKREVEAFLDSLTGFEKWVFDRFPRSVGYLNFDGTSYIEVRDFAGYLYPSISKKRTGENVIDPGLKSLSLEMHLFVPSQTNTNQIVCQKLSGSNQGFTLAISSSASTTACDVIFLVTSGAQTLSVTGSVVKGQFNHIGAVLDRHPGINNVKLYVNEELEGESINIVEFGEMSFATSSFMIGTGSLHSHLFTPVNIFSGAIDELRVFHAARTLKEQQLYARKSIFPTSDLRLYLKFNEPTGSIGPNSLVIDSSGNSLHSQITNFSHALRSTGSLTGPMTYERANLHPVLFPAYTEVQDLNSDLLSSASAYDAVNPNLITRLIPPHYFEEGQVFEGLQSEDGTIVDAIEGQGPPGSAELGSAQLLSSFLYVWAKFFDELKMVIDLFGTVIHVDYDKPGFTADQFLPFVAKYYGFEMPAFFVDSSIEQFIDAENVSDQISTNEASLQYVQNQLWRRILTDLGEIVRSKGTLHSVKSLFRTMGIEPDTNFKIREFGGPTFRNLSDARDVKADLTTLVNFSGTLAAGTVTPLLVSPFLSASRVEPGFPLPKGSFTATDVLQVSHSNDPSDGLLTSGSWTYEGLYRFPSLMTGSHAVTQSLVRFVVTGSSLPSSGGLVTNLVATSGSDVILYVSPGYSGSNPVLRLPLTGADVMDGQLWNVQFGRMRADETGSFVSSSYFLRASRQSFGTIIESYVTSALFLESGSTSGGRTIFDQRSFDLNASGAFFVIGSGSITTTGVQFLNSASVTTQARATDFSGLVGQVRFWSKALNEDEWFEHTLNPRSIGVIDPKVNFNFNTRTSGSFQRLRLDASAEQPVTESNSIGQFTLFDFSQNGFHLSGSGFEASHTVMYPQRIFFSQLSPRFDEAASTNKVRIRSFQDYRNVERLGGEVAPVYEIPRSDEPNDDVRFSIDFSIMDALDEDIIKIFATLNEFDNAIGSPELVFSPDYPSLEDLRDVYFNRLTDRVRLKQFFEFFKWFDSILGISTFIDQLIPRKTMFLGTNFVIESHMLERPKVEYLFSDIYLGENNRHGLKGTILLQQFVGSIKRY